MPPEVAVRAVIGGKTFSLEVADSPNERRLGLGGRDGLDEGHAMLFVWPEERPVTMWMKDVLFDLDAVFIDEELRVITVHAMKAQPGESLDELVRYRSGEPVKYVLEIVGSLAEECGFALGMEVRLE